MPDLITALHEERARRVSYLADLLQRPSSARGECEQCHHEPRDVFTDDDEPGEFQRCGECIAREIARHRRRAGHYADLRAVMQIPLDAPMSDEERDALHRLTIDEGAR